MKYFCTIVSLVPVGMILQGCDLGGMISGAISHWQFSDAMHDECRNIVSEDNYAVKEFAMANLTALCAGNNTGQIQLETGREHCSLNWKFMAPDCIDHLFIHEVDAVVKAPGSCYDHVLNKTDLTNITNETHAEGKAHVTAWYTALDKDELQANMP